MRRRGISTHNLAQDSIEGRTLTTQTADHTHIRATNLAAVLGYLLSLRELDINHMLPAGNATLIRYLYGVVHTGSDDKTAFLAVLLAALVLLPALAARLLGVPGVDCGRERADP